MKKFLCTIFGHQYTISKRITAYLKSYTCADCNDRMAIDTTDNSRTLTPELVRINQTLEQVYLKRHIAARQHRQY